MAGSKYAQYILKRPIEKRRFGAEFRFTGEEDFGSNFSVNLISVTEPMQMESYAHSHDFDIYLTFLGFDPDNMDDLGAEIEFSFGEEEEKYSIEGATTIYIPAGLVHCPLNFKKVTKPILFIHATMAPRYFKKEPQPPSISGG